MSSFTDTRLHVVVRPSLEYLLPQSYAAVCSVLMGDYDKAHGFTALDTLAQLTTPPPPLANDVLAVVVKEGVVAVHEAEVEAEVERRSAEVCTHVAEYLHTLLNEWRVYADGVARGARLSVQRITEDANRADAVCRMYRGRNATVVDREHRAELQRLHNELHTARTALRDRPTPTTQRSEELASACEHLKRCFGSAYHKTPTVRLLARKRHFEHSLLELQHSVAMDATAHLRSLLAQV